ncbi:hypothetical protein HUE87_05070 [Candidatus Sulfurimonas marisnigri]|uniref:Uncharacterized protein n=1 Tax=Candidatus Sulfurimonas marisnigri TaxID=2740405 RepID=A0A7S7RQN3_9BACT|nr:hypothetical protein [Candidatus Sulfurimonas marisnigri]QOY55602.1 hypothetical protein HUE87_05070 [Candidatus Sulfurimonas marisnigri]
MINKILILLFILLNYVNGDDCYPDRYYYNYNNKKILNIPLKQECMLINRVSNFKFNLGYFFFAGKNPFQVPKIFSAIQSPAYFSDEILNELKISNGKYQPMLIYSNDDKYTFILVLEIDEIIYKFNVTSDYFDEANQLSLYPSGYGDTDKEQHYPIFIDDNKLIFIATNHLKVIDAKKYIFSSDIYFIEIELPFNGSENAEVIHKGYYLLPKGFRNYSNKEIKNFFKKSK